MMIQVGRVQKYALLSLLTTGPGAGPESVTVILSFDDSDSGGLDHITYWHVVLTVRQPGPGMRQAGGSG